MTAKRRPTPMTSSLAGESPIKPAAPAPKRVGRPPKERTEPLPTRVGIYLSEDDANHARGAFMFTRDIVDAQSFSDFLAQGIMQFVEALEAEHNDGKPYPSLPPSRGR